MNHPKYSVLGSSQSPQVLFRNMGSSHWHVSLTINISVGSISSSELHFICCALLRIDLWSTSVSIASTTHQVLYLWCPVVSVTVLRLQPLHGCFSLPRWAKCPPQISWGNVGRNYMQKRNRTSSSMETTLTSQQTQTSAGRSVQLFQGDSPSIPFSTCIHPWWLALGVSRAAAVHLPLVTLSGIQRDTTRTDGRAWPACVPWGYLS